MLVISEPWERFVHAASVLLGEPIAAPPASPTSEPRAAVGEARSAWRQTLSHHLVPAAFLVGAAAFIFHLTLFFGYRLLGNSDRLNHYLSFILYHTHYLERGQFSAWSDFIFDGFDTTALPMSFPTPLYALPTLLHTDDVVGIFGVVAFLLLAITLLETYAVIYYLCHDRLAAVAGATTYTCATYALLKLVQSDQTYLSVLTAPLFFFLIHTTSRRNWPRRFVALTFLVAVECYFAFLQEFSYNVIFFLVYAGYLFLRRNRYPLFTFVAALGAGVLLSVPRLLAQYVNLGASGRGRAEPVLQDVVDLRTLLRFFSRDIFGHSWRDQLALPNEIRLNFHEGDLLHSSVFGALLLVVIILGGRWLVHRGPRPPSLLRSYGLVFVPYILFVFAVMHVPRVYLLFDRLYLNVSFQHSRLSVSAMLPVAVLTALFIAEARGRLSRRDIGIVLAVSALLVGLSALNFSDVLDHLRAHTPIDAPLYLLTCAACPARFNPTPILTWDLVRFVTLTIAFAIVVGAGFALGVRGKRMLATVLAVTIVFQTVWGAEDYLEGPQTRNYNVPWENNDFVVARSDQFVSPTPAQIDQLHQVLDNDNYRSVILCPGNQFTYPDCNTAMGMTWSIRLMDGYANGVPHPLAVLPDLPVTLHDLRFGPTSDLHWRTLGFLNVRQAIGMTRELFMNSNLRIPDGIHLVSNPSPYIYPRAYFASETRSVSADVAQEEVTGELKDCTPECDGLLHRRFPIDYVEGGTSGTFDASGTLSWSGGGDRLTFDFPASDQPRFLVVNEMWDRGWSATADGQPVAVWPTNVAMRGMLIPPGASHVELVYHSFLWWAWWYVPAVGLLIGLAVFVVWRRWLRAA